MMPPPNADLLGVLAAAARVASAIAVLVGCAVLAGWALGLPALESLFPGMATMKVNTALNFVLAGLSLWGAQAEPGHRSLWRAIAWYAGATIVGLVGLLTLAEYISGWNLGIDRVPLPGSPAASNAIAAGRMAPATAFNFLLISSALLLLDDRHGRKLSRWLTFVALAIALLALTGYLYGVRSLYAIVPYTSMALHTALTFAVLGVGLLCARPGRGATAVLVGDGTGSVLLRRLLPAAIGLPLILGWLRLAGERAGLYDATFGLALFALSNVIVFTVLVWRNAVYLNQADSERRQVEQRLQRFNEELELRVSERTMQLTAAYQALEQANLAKDRFLANMSHELRTPLNAIIGFTGTLLMRLPGPLTPDQERQLATIQSSAKHLLALINDVLDVARIDSGKRDLHLEPVACQEVAAEVIAVLAPLAASKGISLAIDRHGQDITLLTDRRALSQILLNLVSNAIKFTDTGEVVVSLRTEGRGLRTETEPEALSPQSSVPVAFAVRDTGIGIRQADQAKLFQVFTQVDASSAREYEGTGLGLYLCQKLAEMLNGRITFQSEYGQGSTFTLMLAQQPHPQASPEREPSLAAQIERT